MRKTELPDLSNYVLRWIKNDFGECTNNASETFIFKISMKIVFIGVYANKSRTVVYGGDILSFHIFEKLKHNVTLKHNIFTA